MPTIGQNEHEGNEAREARAWLPDGTSLRVVAATHEAICVPAERAWRPGDKLEVSLGDARRLVGPLEMRVASVDGGPNGGRYAILRFGAMALERRRRLAELLLKWPASLRRFTGESAGLTTAAIRDPQRILALLSTLGGEGQAGLVRLAQGSYTGTRVRALETDLSDDLPVKWVLDGPAPAPPCLIETGACEFMYVLPIVRARVDGDMLSTALPDEVLRVSSAAAWLRSVGADGPEVRIAELGARSLRRASRGRVAFALAGGDPVRPGDRLHATIVGDRRDDVDALLEVESLRPSPDGDEALAVARLTPGSPADRERWDELRERLLHPHTRRAGTWAGNLWELYDKSGYFQLSGKTSAHFTPLRQAFALATRRLDTAPEIGCQVVWPGRARVEAAVSVLLVYAGTAMVYQVARRRDDASPAAARQMLREINLHAFEHLRRDPAFEWTLVYVQEGGARWSHLAYQTFCESHVQTGLSVVLRFRALQSTTSLVGPAPPRSISVGEATEDERALFFVTLPRLRRQPYLEALDLVPDRFDLDDVRRRWRRAGFTRERALLVAREDGVPVAAAVLELAQDALHLFGLLDCVRFFPLQPGGQRTYPHLVQGARDWFRAHGKETFVCFYEAEGFDAADDSGLTDLGAAHFMAFPRLLMGEFLEHLYAITAPRTRGH